MWKERLLERPALSISLNWVEIFVTWMLLWTLEKDME
jgi:hypothetical protein